VAGTGATCAVLPEAINSARTAVSFGCIGSRVYPGLTTLRPTSPSPASTRRRREKLAVIVRANQEMEKFHRGRAAATPTA
jgi:hypothetical protein